MKKFLLRLFLKRGMAIESPEARKRCGFLSAIVGVFANLLLFCIKFIAGTLSGSVSVCADAFNNLSDAGSSVISFISFHLSSKPADRDHPYGHERIEYVCSMIVSFLILLVGYEIGKSAIEKIFSDASATVFEWVTVLALAFSICFKLALFVMNKTVGNAIDSEVLRATAADCIADVVSSTAVLASMLVFRFTGLDLDGYVGLGVAAFIVFAGIKILNETKNSILGEAPSSETEAQILEILKEFPEALGMHDMIVHSYGPSHTMASLHVEVDGKNDFYEMHDMIDNIERTVKERMKIDCTIHLDPIVVGDERVDRLREKTSKIVCNIDERMKIHDFRCVIGSTHINLIFDIAVPFEIKDDDDTIKEKVGQAVASSCGENYFCVAYIERQ